MTFWHEFCCNCETKQSDRHKHCCDLYSVVTVTLTLLWLWHESYCDWCKSGCDCDTNHIVAVAETVLWLWHKSCDCGRNLVTLRWIPMALWHEYLNVSKIGDESRQSIEVEGQCVFSLLLQSYLQAVLNLSLSSINILSCCDIFSCWNSFNNVMSNIPE